jgi:hypothetical protein
MMTMSEETHSNLYGEVTPEIRLLGAESDLPWL